MQLIDSPAMIPRNVNLGCCTFRRDSWMRCRVSSLTDLTAARPAPPFFPPGAQRHQNISDAGVVTGQCSTGPCKTTAALWHAVAPPRVARMLIRQDFQPEGEIRIVNILEYAIGALLLVSVWAVGMLGLPLFLAVFAFLLGTSLRAAILVASLGLIGIVAALYELSRRGSFSDFP
jgi:hypothetical protein